MKNRILGKGLPFSSRHRVVPKIRHAPGASPGTLIADPLAGRTEIEVIAFGPGGLREETVAGPEGIEDVASEMAVVWINVNGLADLDLIRAISDKFSFHSLAIEDVVNTYQRPKADDFDNHIFTVMRRFEVQQNQLLAEQISAFLIGRYLITFQERPGDCFDSVRERIRSDKGRIRKSGADYLMYALIDAVIDSYYPLIEYYGEELQGIEEDVLKTPDVRHVNTPHRIKRDLMLIRRALMPEREAIGALLRDDSRLIAEPTRVYLRDCYDHAIQCMDSIEVLREIASGLVELYLSSQSSRMNEVMKVLTIIATIFIPLGFIAGLYGMNFDSAASPYNMPELRWPWGYPIALGFMALVAACMVFYFWRKGWIGRERGSPDRPSPDE